MRSVRLWGAAICALVLVSPAFGQKVVYEEAKPLSDVVKEKLRPLSALPAKWKNTLIQWGGEVADVYAVQAGIYKSEGLEIELWREDDMVKQVEACLRRETPFVRGTLDMIIQAAPVFEAQGQPLVVIYAKTWSDTALKDYSGDGIVVRDTIKSMKDFSGKTGVTQRYGPHNGLIARINADMMKAVQASGGIPQPMKLLFARDLYDLDPENRDIYDAPGLFHANTQIDFVTGIIPDLLRLTANGSVGIGGESAKGARIFMTTKSASKVIVDVIAVPRDVFEANKDKLQRFVHCELVATERLRDLREGKPDSKEFTDLVKASAKILMGSDSKQGQTDLLLLLDGCKYQGHQGQLDFFTGVGTSRNLRVMTEEFQDAFIDLKLLRGPVRLLNANWDYAALAKGLKYVNEAFVEATKFDPHMADRKIEAKVRAESATWEQEYLYSMTVHFEPEQEDFPLIKYQKEFGEAISTMESYGGALIIVEAHTDPLEILKQRKLIKDKKTRGENTYLEEQKLAKMEERAKELSDDRAESLAKTLRELAASRGVKIPEGNIRPKGMGIAFPLHNPPKTAAEWKDNMRGVIRFENVEAELKEFVPLSE